ncbi:MAG TPA: YhjD/YihY/BrkB family envelope integrity protein [Gaiellales bacterium]|nr:YhjD/YihY/BrkB family envelope integrity protein [Gaiellales bacterium]
MSAGHRLRALLRRTVSKAWHDRILGLSAEAAFWQLLSLPPLILASIASLGYVANWFGPDTVRRVQAQIEAALSRGFSSEFVDETITPTLNEVLHGQRIGLISIGFILALWAGSSGTATYVNTITIAYDMRDQRGAVRSRLLALGLFLGMVLIGVIALPLLVLSPRLVVNLFPDEARHTARSIVNGAYYPTLVVLLLIGLTTLYHLAPPRRLPWHRGVPGAVLAFAVFFGGAAGLRSYITFIVRQSHAYGALAGPNAASLFLFILALGVLLGAEFNAAIEWMWPSRQRRPRALHPRRWIRLEKEQPSGPEPVAHSADPPWPGDPIVRPTEPTGEPAEPIEQHADASCRPADPIGQPPDPITRPAGPITPAADSLANGVTEPSGSPETRPAARVESPVGSGPFRFGRRRRQPSDPPPGGRLS